MAGPASGGGASIRYAVDSPQLKQLHRRLNRLEDDVRKKILRRAVGKGIRVIRKQIKANTPVGNAKWVKGQKIAGGTLKRSVDAVVRKYLRDTYVGITGPKYPEGPHAHLVEYGTQQRYTKASGILGLGKRASRGRMKPNPFMRRAYDATRVTAMKAVEAEIVKGLFRGR